MVKTERFQQIPIREISELRSWLTLHGQQQESVWLLLYKKEFGKYYIAKQDIIDELLCFGWLDGLVRKVDEHQYLLLISPRRTEYWSATYKNRIPLLQKTNRMTTLGLNSVELAKQNGTWDFYNDVDQLIKPADFEQKLMEFPDALMNFNAFGASSQRFTLRWIKLAKTAATRLQRIELAATLANQNKKIPGL
ncbi:MAG: hypothetical protein EAY72_08095 [Bacteroidetes bacterium]|nr:MAG: hypothetical protein EAY72_08095 [Bacteroidota bacterium]